MENKIMNLEDIYFWGIDIIIENVLKPNGAKILGVTPDINKYPSIIIEEDTGKKAYVFVDTAIYPKKAFLTTCKKYDYTTFANESNTKAYYVSVNITNHNKEHERKNTHYDNDEYHISTTDFKLLKLNHIDDPLNDEYKFDILKKIGNGYYNLDYSLFSKYIDEKCDWVNFFTNEIRMGKTAIDEYYIPKFETLKKNNLTVLHSLCEYDGCTTKPLHTTEPKTYVETIQDSGKPLLLLDEPIDGTHDYVLIDVDFNNEGKIIKIEMKNPTIYKLRFAFSFS